MGVFQIWRSIFITSLSALIGRVEERENYCTYINPRKPKATADDPELKSR